MVVRVTRIVLKPSYKFCGLEDKECVDLLMVTQNTCQKATYGGTQPIVDEQL